MPTAITMSPNKSTDVKITTNLEKKTKKKISKMTEDVSTMDFVLKNIKLLNRLKRCRVRLLKVTNNKLLSKKQIDFGKIKSKKDNNLIKERKGAKTTKEKTKEKPKKSLTPRNVKTSEKSTNDKKETISINGMEETISTNDKKETIENNSKPKVVSEELESKKEKENIKNSSRRESNDNQQDKKQIENVKSTPIIENQVDSRKSVSPSEKKIRSRSSKSPEESIEKNKRKEKKKVRQIFIQLPFLENAKLKSLNKEISERNSIKRKVYKKRAPAVKRLGRTYLTEKFGGRYFRCHVKVARYRDPNDPAHKKKDKINRKSVSFVETVEIFGESDDDTSSIVAVDAASPSISENPQEKNNSKYREDSVPLCLIH